MTSRAPELPPITATADVLVSAAVDYLVIARELLKAAKAVKAVERVRLAISSAKGAKRHAELAPFRQARQAAP